MQLVINIDDKLYEIIKNPKKLETMYHAGRLCEAVRNGTPLPKGHGDLVYREDVCNELRYMDNNGCITRSVNHVIEDIKKGVPIIIKADKEGE